MKKTLALVLALVMVIGLMAVPVKADFTDSSSIEYTEAVDVLSATGVINGFENGSFDPAGNLTREQAAKIVAYLLLGEKNADALAATSAPFADVAADRWSAGYIAYCVNEGIINGRDANTFDPTGKVTGYEFAKLLLGCLGYSSKIEQYVGASWAINVAKTALDIELFDGNDGANYNAPMTREEAALYAFNTLKATLVDYDSQGTSIDLGNGVVISTGASKAEAVADAGDNKDTIDHDALLQFAEKYFSDLEYTATAATADDFGRPAVIWTFDNDEVGTYADEADFTYTADTKASVFDKDLKDYTVGGHKVQTDIAAGSTDAVVYANSATVGNLTVAVDESPADAIADLTAKGRLIEIYADDDDAITAIVVIDTYVGQITDWTAADEDEDEDEYVTVKILDAAGDPSGAGMKFETTAFTDDDVDDDTVVLFTKAGTEVQSVVAAESVAADITTVTAGTSFVAGGTTYKYSVNKNATVATSTVDDDGKEYDIYLDSYGYVIFTTAASDDSDTTYAFVAGIRVDDEWGDDPIYYAKLVLADGTQVTAELDKDSFAAGTYLEAAYASFKDDVVEYTVDSDDVYTLEDTTPVADAEDNFSITKGSTKIVNGLTVVVPPAVPAPINVYADSDTIYLVAETDGTDVDYTSYTGYKNVPSIEDKAATTACIVMDGDNVAFVFVKDAVDKSSTSTDDIVFVQAASKSDDITDADYDDAYYTVNAVVSGEIVELKVKATTLTGADLIVDGYTVNKEGLITAWGDAVTADVDYAIVTKAVDISAPSNDVLKVAGISYAYDDDTLVFEINDDDEEITASSIDDISSDDTGVATLVTYEDVLVAVYIYVD